MRVFARTFLIPLVLVVMSVWAQSDDYRWGIVAGLIYCVFVSAVLDAIRVTKGTKL